jgi:carbamate kinase
VKRHRQRPCPFLSETGADTLIISTAVMPPLNSKENQKAISRKFSETNSIWWRAFARSMKPKIEAIIQFLEGAAGSNDHLPETF